MEHYTKIKMVNGEEYKIRMMMDSCVSHYFVDKKGEIHNRFITIQYVHPEMHVEMSIQINPTYIVSIEEIKTQMKLGNTVPPMFKVDSSHHL